jgi:hypothetical protein
MRWPSFKSRSPTVKDNFRETETTAAMVIQHSIQITVTETKSKAFILDLVIDIKK